MPPTGGLACIPGTFPDWESNQRPSGSQASPQSTEPHQPGHKPFLYCKLLFMSYWALMHASKWTPLVGDTTSLSNVPCLALYPTLLSFQGEEAGSRRSVDSGSIHQSLATEKYQGWGGDCYPRSLEGEGPMWTRRKQTLLQTTFQASQP